MIAVEHFMICDELLSKKLNVTQGRLFIKSLANCQTHIA